MSRKRKHIVPVIRAQRDTPRAFCCVAPCDITAADGKLPAFAGTAYTGAPMRPDGWWQQVIIDLNGVKIPSQTRPALRQHDHEQIVGHTTSVKADKSGIQVMGVLSGQPEHVEKVTIPAKNGFQWQLSVGANPVRTEFLEDSKETTVNGRKVTGPMTISRETEIGEISFVPLGADGATSVSVAASKGKNMNPFRDSIKVMAAALKSAGKLDAAKYSDEEVDAMDESTAKAALKECVKMDAAQDDSEDEEDAEAAAKTATAKQAKLLKAEAASVMKQIRADAAAEHQRQAAITAAVKRHGVTEVEIDGKQVNLTAHAIENDWSPEKAELHALRAARPGAGAGVPGGLGYSTSAPGITGAVLEAAVLHAFRHQFRLEDPDFYLGVQDGIKYRRVPEHIQREVQSEMRGRYTDQVQQGAHTLFKGRITLRQLLEVGFQANGRSGRLDLAGEQGVRSMLASWDDMEKTGLRAEGSSNISISNVLANVLNKFSLQGYLFTEQAWREISGIRAVNDFKPTKSINLLGDVMFKALGPTGALENATLTDQAFANVAAPYGRLITIPWTHIVNDDLSILSTVPMKIGQGAGLALNSVFWSLWAALAAGSTSGLPNVPQGAGVNGDDGNAFWRTSSSTTAAAKAAGTAYQKNKISGASTALSSTSLTTAKAAFDNQIDPNGNPLGFDGAMPTILFGPTLWRTATELVSYREIVYGGSTAAMQPQGNVWAGTMKPVMSRYIENASFGNTTTGWWVLYNPAALPVIEVSFLNGVDTPAVLQAGPDYQFDKLGISIRGTMPFGVSQQNFRGGVYSVGA